MTFKEVISHIFLLVAWLFSSLVYAIEDGPTNEEKPVPKAIAVSKVEVKDPTKIPRALPVQNNEAIDELAIPKAIPIKEDSDEVSEPIENKSEETNNIEDNPVEEKEPPKKFELPPLPPIQDNILKELEKENQDVRAAWETQTEARTLTLKVPAPRGQITDRNGDPLAQNKLGYFVALKFPYFKESKALEIINYAKERITYIKDIYDSDWSLSDERIIDHYKNRRWLPLPFSPMLSEEQVETFKSQPKAGLELFPTYQRFYPGEGLACHVVGYVGKKAKAPSGAVVPGELLWPITEGREGLEKTFDDRLQGSPGKINYLFDPNGVKLAEEVIARPVPGKNVITSIDIEMQTLAEKVLSDHTERGAFVVMDCITGDVYALASRPTYDINVWIPAITNNKFKELQEDPDLPLFPRAFRGQYPPASAFKISVALAALENGTVDQNTLIDCPRSIQIGDKIFRNWSKKPEGNLNVMNAIMRSCNTWFYVVGRETGGENIASMAHRFGFGEKTGLPLSAEEDGFIPTNTVLQEKYGHSFTGGYVAHASIGQGYVLSTPIQVAQMMAGVGNGYIVPKPRLVLQVQDLNNNVTENFFPEEKNALNVSQENLSLIRQGMVDVVNASSGTAMRARNEYVTMSGKTGTGQWVQNGEKLLISWFAGCVPAENPRFAFAAICEGNPGQEITGSNKSAPMVGEFFNSLYELKKERGELEDYSKTAVASTFKLPDDQDNEQSVDEVPSEGSNTLRRLLNPFRKKR